jgi:hypothetical protein
MSFTEHVVRMREMRYEFRIFLGKPQERRQLAKLDVDGRMLLKYI